MASYVIRTKMKMEEAVQKAASFFGETLKLDIIDQSNCCVRFRGGGGHVNVYAETHNGETEIRIETREWDHQVKQFFEQI